MRTGFVGCRSQAGAIHEEKDGRRCHFPILVGLAVAAIVWVASYRGGTSKRGDANIPNPPVAAITVAASALNGTTSEAQMTDIEQVARNRELLGKN
jgi:hypothetical protein